LFRRLGLKPMDLEPGAMMGQGLARYETTLAGLERKGRRRILIDRAGADFTSNDYLALAGSARLAAAIASALERGVPVVPAVRGCCAATIRSTKRWKRRPPLFRNRACLYFGSGYAANTALFSTLPQRGHLVVYDALVHASAHEGIQAGKAQAVAAAHNDVESFAQAIEHWRSHGGTGHPWIAVESLYSMDGDRAPLAELAAVAEKHDAVSGDRRGACDRRFRSRWPRFCR
jgi:8-amino-7-oxononanoate synthase